MQKQAIFKIKGMQRDLSASAFNSDFAYENKNVRIMPTNEGTLLSLINEKGNKAVNISGVGNHIKGIPIGQSLINDELVLFTCGDDFIDKEITIDSEDLQIDDITAEESSVNLESSFDDRIYKLWLDGGNLKGKELFKGDLNFNYKNPIEAVPFYENSDIRKIYWTDGLNQPRVINVAAATSVMNKWNNDSFNFARRLKLNETVSIERNLVASGNFAPGVIQYAFTYFNKYGQESNIFYTSPLYYISYNNRGASPEDKVSNSFNISIDNVDNSFDYVRVYSIHRTSINATPTVKRVVDLAPIAGTTYQVKYTDNGISGDLMDPVELLYLGGEEVVFGTMSQKDNTLFLGDIKVKRKMIDSTIKNFFRGKTITFGTELYLYEKSITPPQPKGYYPYDNQLKLNSHQIKAFKYLEWYRFGIQAQHYTGKWSEPIWINDARNTKHITTTFYKDNDIHLPIALYVLNDQSIINRFIENGYTRIRAVVVYPTINDREAVCQGILCPTVYNVSDRYSNSPFAQSSWFIRPNAPFDINKTFPEPNTGEYTPLTAIGNAWESDSDPSLYSRGGIMSNNRAIVDDKFTIDGINKGAWAEFRHNYPIPDNGSRNAEIQCISNPPTSPVISEDYSESSITEWVSENSENFYVDQSILTLHSPDIEFDDEVRSIDTSALKLRIVGMVPLTAFASDIDIQTSTPVNNFHNSSESPAGFYKEHIGVENKFTTSSPLGTYSAQAAHFGWRGLISGAFWFDELSERNGNNSDKYTTAFVVYPWHRNGSLNNTGFPKDGYRSAMLDKKKLYNMKYSYKSVYLADDNIWNAYVSGDSDKTGISGVSIFDSNERSLVKIPAQQNSNLEDINYYGNVDKVVTIPRIGSKKDGYPIKTSGTYKVDGGTPHDLFSGNYLDVDSDASSLLKGTDSVRIKYKSTPHAVLALNYTNDGYQRVLPTIKDGDRRNTLTTWNVNYVGKALGTDKFFWDKDKDTLGVSQDVITTDIGGPVNNIYSIQHGWLWLGELYNDNVKNRFGGQTEEAFENNQWLPCGDPISLIDNSGAIKGSVTIKWEEGDTYYQRYDHIKTYPFTLEDQNSVTEVVSFMCETRVNIDGRYDRNRGQTSNFAITPENFNKLNDVYSQPNNFFNYRGVSTDKLNLDNFHNSITWTKTKTVGELIDTWTNITLASILDLDGDKGSVRALRRFNNNILAFQDRGISQILYNETMQVASTEGVPIEIANSGKVSGKRYITDRVGCTNKWSICETSNGIYFIDDITKGIYLFTGKLDNISDKLGFHSWINAASDSVNIWDPVDFNGFVTYYDKINGDVFFINKDECLAFSEPLGQFTSFYSYEKMPYFTNLEDKSISFNTEYGGAEYKPWIHNEGDYNMFFGKYQPFYTTIVVNPNVTTDKVFNNLEFRSDSWNKEGELLNTTFDTLTTWNEYQSGTSSLVNILGRPSDLKRKFRIWRANIPRDKVNGRDRMRNPWLYIKLSMDNQNTNKTILHDMVVHYFE